MIQEEGFGLGPGLSRESIHQKGEMIQELSEEGFGLGPGLDNRCLFENKHPVSCYLCPDIYFLAPEWNALNSDDKHPASCFLFPGIRMETHGSVGIGLGTGCYKYLDTTRQSQFKSNIQVRNI